MTTPARIFRDPAYWVGMLAIACLMVGAVWPWFAGANGVVGVPPSRVLLWLTVIAGIGTLVVALLRPRLVLIPLALLLVSAFATATSADPGWMCWDGVDADGNMVGGCVEDEWTPIGYVFAAGVLLSVVVAATAWLRSRRRR
ncbi:hypothetical protein [Pseudactinotalea terrae]|uniref:hypothetical protein n=1 Tax=Pseudactinotalea terrae TaxID=1743262 RepID=UPI0012E23D06|nr:hypothetical protein [Pseudactinotalea terrae]